MAFPELRLAKRHLGLGSVTFTRALSAWLFALGTTWAQTPPVNDDFNNALSLTGTNIVISGNNAGATIEPNEPRYQDGPGLSLWYTWEAPASGRAWLTSTVGRTPRFTTVYTGTALTNLQALRRVSSTPQSLLFLATAGTTYHLQVEGTDDGQTAFQVRLELTDRGAPNDDFAQGWRLGGPRIMDLAWITAATLEPGEPTHPGPAPNKSLWWHWQAPNYGELTFYAFSSLLPEVAIAIYRGSTVDGLTLVAKGTNGVALPVIGGEAYHFAAVVGEEIDTDVVVDLFLRINPLPHPVPGNLLQDPSFEDLGFSSIYWTIAGTVEAPAWGTPEVDGVRFPVLSSGGKIWQELPTVPGRTYEVRFAFLAPTARMRVLWDDRELGVVTVPAGDWFWYWTNYSVAATSMTSKLTFTNLLGVSQSGPGMALDAVSVVWPTEPPSIITAPVSASTIVGGAAGFSAQARGSPPLSFQWLFEGSLLNGQTNRALTLSKVLPTQAGEYRIVVTNAFGAVTSNPVTLTVENPSSPVILLQPAGDTVVEGGYFTLTVAASGPPPLLYQWYRDSEALSGATNSRLIFISVQASNAGLYSVTVSSPTNAVESLPARIVVVPALEGGGGWIWLNNNVLGLVEAPVYDVDGTTKIVGSNYLGQVYGGLTPETLRPAGEPRGFRSSGYIRSAFVQLPNVPPGSNAFVQVRAWAAHYSAASYEEARATGGRFGKSTILQMVAQPIEAGPGTMCLIGLESFSLQAGVPFFNVGVIRVIERRTDGSIELGVQGEPGFRYLVERATNGYLWKPLLVLTNTTGDVTFVDSTAPLEGTALYRSRILD